MDVVLADLPSLLNHPRNLNASGISELICNVLELMRDNEHPPKLDNLAPFTANTGLDEPSNSSACHMICYTSCDIVCDTHLD